MTDLENKADERGEAVCSKGRVKHSEMSSLTTDEERVPSGAG